MLVLLSMLDVGFKVIFEDKKRNNKSAKTQRNGSSPLGNIQGKYYQNTR